MLLPQLFLLGLETSWFPRVQLTALSWKTSPKALSIRSHKARLII